MIKGVTFAVTAGGILVLASTFPQAIQTLTTKTTRDINLLFTIFAIAGIAFYVYYAVKTKQWIFAVADGIDTGLWCIILFYKLTNVLSGQDAWI